MYVCGSQLANKLKSFASVVCSAQLLQMVTDLRTWGLWCKTPTSGTYIRTCRLAVHNSKMRDKVTQVLASDAQLLKTLQSYARGGLWCTIHKFGSKLCAYGLVVHNSERWNLVTQVLVCDAQLRKGEKLCTWGLLVQNSQLRHEVLYMWPRRA